MKKLIGLVFIFGIAYVFLVFKPSLNIPAEGRRGLYDTPLSEMVIINGVQLGELTSVDESEHHDFNAERLFADNGDSMIDKCMYLHDSIQDSGGLSGFITNTMSKDMQQRVDGMMADAREKMDENLYSDIYN